MKQVLILPGAAQRNRAGQPVKKRLSHCGARISPPPGVLTRNCLDVPKE
jgi:hypothetical protein